MSHRPPRVVRLLALAPVLLIALAMADLVGIARGVSAVPVCPSDVALVMGAAQYDGRPSPALERRLARALDLYERGCVGHVVVSGGAQPGDRSTEGRAGTEWLAARGVDRGDLTAEESARTSVENIRNSLSELRGRSVVIVSDDLHVWRATWLARREGLDASASAVRAGGDRIDYVLREWLAMTAYRLGVIR